LSRCIKHSEREREREREKRGVSRLRMPIYVARKEEEKKIK
jgi:hypothetical protein